MHTESHSRGTAHPRRRNYTLWSSRKPLVSHCLQTESALCFLPKCPCSWLATDTKHERAFVLGPRSFHASGSQREIKVSESAVCWYQIEPSRVVVDSGVKYIWLIYDTLFAILWHTQIFWCLLFLVPSSVSTHIGASTTRAQMYTCNVVCNFVVDTRLYSAGACEMGLFYFVTFLCMCWASASKCAVKICATCVLCPRAIYWGRSRNQKVRPHPLRG